MGKVHGKIARTDAPRKSLTMGKLKIPNKYFFDFLRGCFDGDGCFYSYWDPRWRSSHMFYLEFVSASKKHINWLQNELKKKLDASVAQSPLEDQPLRAER